MTRTSRSSTAAASSSSATSPTVGSTTSRRPATRKMRARASPVVAAAQQSQLATPPLHDAASMSLSPSLGPMPAATVLLTAPFTTAFLPDDLDPDTRARCEAFVRNPVVHRHDPDPAATSAGGGVPGTSAQAGYLCPVCGQLFRDNWVSKRTGGSRRQVRTESLKEHLGMRHLLLPRTNCPVQDITKCSCQGYIKGHRLISHLSDNRACLLAVFAQIELATPAVAEAITWSLGRTKSQAREAGLATALWHRILKAWKVNTLVELTPDFLESKIDPPAAFHDLDADGDYDMDASVSPLPTTTAAAAAAATPRFLPAQSPVPAPAATVVFPELAPATEPAAAAAMSQFDLDAALLSPYTFATMPPSPYLECASGGSSGYSSLASSPIANDLALDALWLTQLDAPVVVPEQSTGLAPPPHHDHHHVNFYSAPPPPPHEPHGQQQHEPHGQQQHEPSLEDMMRELQTPPGLAPNQYPIHTHAQMRMPLPLPLPMLSAPFATQPPPPPAPTTIFPPALSMAAAMHHHFGLLPPPPPAPVAASTTPIPTLSVVDYDLAFLDPTRVFESATTAAAAAAAASAPLAPSPMYPAWPASPFPLSPGLIAPCAPPPSPIELAPTSLLTSTSTPCSPIGLLDHHQLNCNLARLVADGSTGAAAANDDFALAWTLGAAVSPTPTGYGHGHAHHGPASPLAAAMAGAQWPWMSPCAMPEPAVAVATPAAGSPAAAAAEDWCIATALAQAEAEAYLAEV
ncbi:hypothetical protein H9P43_006278 [Blastocladiella emersonii ATCC 22665]|nr:hypothetical protein H9P43_006278 [Blastocladiella emersonii ATCC 22665]